tara:strand:- start:738 stop:1130 length:393 start_codon:yes stop_codon:yes gene_type:complete
MLVSKVQKVIRVCGVKSGREVMLALEVSKVYRVQEEMQVRLELKGCRVKKELKACLVLGELEERLVPKVTKAKEVFLVWKALPEWRDLKEGRAQEEQEVLKVKPAQWEILELQDLKVLQDQQVRKEIRVL